MDKQFWTRKTLEEMDQDEWEALCDGCGRCCLLKIEDEDSGELFYTNVICEYHDNEHCVCTQYRDRSLLVPDCIKVTPEVAAMRETVVGSSLFSPFPFHSVYSVEDQKKHVDWIKTVNPRALISVICPPARYLKSGSGGSCRVPTTMCRDCGGWFKISVSRSWIDASFMK